MKVIDLLNKIANGKEIPKKIRYDSDTYYYIEDNREGVCYINTALDRENVWSHFLYNIDTLNDKIEVIEEQKEETTTRKSIEALGYACGEIQKCFTNGWGKSLKNKSLNEEDKKIRKITLLGEEIKLGSLSNWLKDSTNNEEKIASCIECNAMKINEIIDYINGGTND